MNPGNPIMVKCPYCGAEKELMTLMSGNTCGAEYWSDGKMIASMLPKISPVQKCPQCDKYYIEHKQKSRMVSGFSLEKGLMPFSDWRKAYYQFQTEEIEDEDMMNIRYWIVQSFNDTFYRNKIDQLEPTADDYSFFKEIVLLFVDSYKQFPMHDSLLIAEFYREANEMEKCKEVLNTIDYEDLKDHVKKIYDGIKNRMERGVAKVFRYA